MSFELFPKRQTHGEAIPILRDSYLCNWIHGQFFMRQAGRQKIMFRLHEIGVMSSFSTDIHRCLQVCRLPVQWRVVGRWRAAKKGDHNHELITELNWNWTLSSFLSFFPLFLSFSLFSSLFSSFFLFSSSKRRKAPARKKCPQRHHLVDVLALISTCTIRIYDRVRMIVDR